MKMKTISRIMIVTSILISNSLFAQDTTHTKLVDKYYPVSKAPEPAPVLDKTTTEPVTSAVESPVGNTTVTQPSQINKINKPVASVPVAAAPVAAVPVTTVPLTPLPVTSISQLSPPQSSIYDDTRLGSSSPEYSTYKTNDNGEGSITTNPNKGTGSNMSIPSANSNTPSPVYRDTRLGSSSPSYNTYEKNDDGAGAVTTNPNKG